MLESIWVKRSNMTSLSSSLIPTPKSSICIVKPSVSCFAVRFIQSLPYVEDAVIGYDDYPKYPIETFVERNGDCEDTSYLAAAIINAMGIDTALLLLPGHMAVGVWGSSDWSGTYYVKNGRRYYYYETTGSGWWFGEVPDEFKGMDATVITIP